MTKKASREVLAAFEAFLGRSAELFDDGIRARAQDLGGRHAAAFGRALVPTNTVGPVPAPRRKNRAASDDPRLLELQARHPVVRAPVPFPENTLDAADVSADEVQTRLTLFHDYVAARANAGELPCVDLPDLHRANSLYDERGNVFLGQNVRRLVLDHRGGKAFLRLLLALETASNNLRNGVTTTKRGLYYYHQAQLPDPDASQVDSDRAIAALANVLGVRRRSLGFVEAHRGRVYGRLVLRDGGQIVDLSQVGTGGHAVPRFTDEVEIVGSDAAFVLIIEKHAVAFLLAQARFWETSRCIIVCGEGFPSVSTREFVRALVDTLAIPALVCVDGDPYGVQNALTYAHGSISTALETPWLACNDVWWAGIHPSDFDHHCGISDTIRLTDQDVATARRLRDHPSEAHVNRRVREEVAILLDRGVKVELDAISRDVSRLVDDYLPKKLFESELVRM